MRVNCVETLSVPKMSRDDKTEPCFSLDGCEEWRRVGDVETESQLSKSTKDLILPSREFLREPSGSDALSGHAPARH